MLKNTNEPNDDQNGDQMTKCKACGDDVKETKIILHLTRSKKGCKETYGKEFDELKTEQAERRKEYKKMKKKEENEKLKKIRAKIHERDSDASAEDQEVQKFHDMQEKE